MNNQDKMREEFEAWFWSKFHEGVDIDAYWGLVFSVGSDGRYNGVACNAAWLAWQASRAAVCVDLPICTNESQDMYYRELIDELELSGVKYK